MKPTRIFDIIEYTHQNYPREDIFGYKHDGVWKKYSTADFITIVNELSLGLKSLGVGIGDKVAIISFNRPEWLFVDLAVQQIGGITVPMYPTITVEDYKFIFGDAEVKLIFAESEDLCSKAKKATAGMAEVEGIYSFDNLSGFKNWNEVRSLGKGGNIEEVNEIKEKVKPEDLLTIIYTSGTTGRPKGVMLTHNNILSNALAVQDIFPIDGKDTKMLSFLPLCHIFERTASYTYMLVGTSMYFAESMEKIADNIKEVKPQGFTTVPRLLEKIYDKIMAKGYELTGVKKKLFFWAVDLANKYELNKNQGWWYDTQLKLANKLIFSKWREALGGEIVFIFSGAAPLQPRLARVFWAAQVKVMEGYGLTETSPGVCFTRSEPEEVRIGMVGSALNDVEVKIAEDGEILVKGPKRDERLLQKARLNS